MKFYGRRNGILGIVLHAGDAGDTMVEHVYYDEKYKIMATKANMYKFTDHVVHCLINTERAFFGYKNFGPSLVLFYEKYF